MNPSSEPGGHRVSTSEAVTHSLRVSVEAAYSSEHSHPAAGRWFFVYGVRITNERNDTVQLVSRHWIITDEVGRVEEVRGLGVVGEQPVLEPGEHFEYTSGCPLTTPTGRMEGTYHMVTADGEQFDIRIAAFELQGPFTVH